MESRRAILGPSHPDIPRGTAPAPQASALAEDGQLVDAEPLFREALRVQQETLGPKHPSTLTSMNNLAMLLKEQGRLAEAEPLYRETLASTRTRWARSTRTPSPA